MPCQATCRQHAALPGSPRHRLATPPLRGADGRDGTGTTGLADWRSHADSPERLTRGVHAPRHEGLGPPGLPRPRRPFPGEGDGPARAGDRYGAGEPGAGEPEAPGAALARAGEHGPAPPADPARAASTGHGSGRAAESGPRPGNRPPPKWRARGTRRPWRRPASASRRAPARADAEDPSGHGRHHRRSSWRRGTGLPPLPQRRHPIGWGAHCPVGADPSAFDAYFGLTSFMTDCHS